MNPQTDYLTAKRRVGRRRRQVVTSSPAPAGPVLVQAIFDAPQLTLMFDREIDLSGIDVNGFVVLDGSVPVEWDGTADVTPLGNGLMIVLIENAEYSGSAT